MAMVSVDGSSLQVDLQGKSVALIWACIYHMNRGNPDCWKCTGFRKIFRFYGYYLNPAVDTPRPLRRLGRDNPFSGVHFVSQLTTVVAPWNSWWSVRRLWLPMTWMSSTFNIGSMQSYIMALYGSITRWKAEVVVRTYK